MYKSRLMLSSAICQEVVALTDLACETAALHTGKDNALPESVDQLRALDLFALEEVEEMRHYLRLRNLILDGEFEVTTGQLQRGASGVTALHRKLKDRWTAPRP